MIASEFPPELGGLGYYVYNLSKELVKKGHRVTVITRGSWKKLSHTHIEGINVYKVLFIPTYPFHVQLHEIFVNKLFKSLESNFDIVHVHVPLPPLVPTSLPTLVTVHTLAGLDSHLFRSLDLRLLGERFFSKFLFAIQFETIRNANAITAVSKFVAKEIEKYYGIDADNVGILSNAVDTKFFVPGKSNNNVPHILYAGRLDYRKGLLDLVKSAKSVCYECPNVSFVLAGTGTFEYRLRKLISELGLSNKFSFVGHTDRNILLKHYQDATVFVLPSHYEGMPTAILEAMACGVPVIGTSAGGIPEIVVDGKTGFLVPTKDPEAIADAILKLLDNDKLRKEMGRASRERIEKYYSWNAVSNNVLDYYKWLI